MFDSNDLWLFGGAGSLTLSTWIFVGSIISLIMNALFLTWYCLRAIFFANNGSRGSADILDCFVCCVCGTPIAVLIILSLIFLLVWFVLGVLIAVNVPDHCKIAYPELFSVGTSCFFIMAASFASKIFVVSKKCPCDR